MSLPETSTVKPCWRWWPLAALLAVTLLVRGGALMAMHERLRDDPDAYRQIAQGWLATGVYTLDVPLDASTIPTTVAPTAFRPPLYPLALTNLAWRQQVAPWSIGVLHWVLGVLTVLLVYRLGLDWGLRQWSLLAALLVACDPILINQSVLVMTETLATLLAVVGLWQLTRFSQRRSCLNALLSGAALGLAVLCRPTFLPWAGLVVLTVLATSGS
ncbi:MAG TPA: glycosyltransferase family 39 protein, partial [Pirellulaceae bacterium]|nr:glycosyltransferase family 39 protein [Pirellulaceae bacterium]